MPKKQKIFMEIASESISVDIGSDLGLGTATGGDKWVTTRPGSPVRLGTTCRARAGNYSRNLASTASLDLSGRHAGAGISFRTSIVNAVGKTCQNTVH